MPLFVQKEKALNEQREEFEEATKVISKQSEERGEKKKAVEMAKVLLEKGIDLDTIAEASGLSKSEVEKLKGE